MGCRDGVPETTETRCRDSSVQARQGIQYPYIVFLYVPSFFSLCHVITGKQQCAEKGHVRTSEAYYIQLWDCGRLAGTDIELT